MRVVVVNQNNNSWSLPKGHLEKGETSLQAARREIYEESGIRDLQKICLLGTYFRPKIALTGGNDPSEIKKITLFLFFTHEKKLKPIDKDNPQARWMRMERVGQLLTHQKDVLFYENKINLIKQQLKKFTKKIKKK